MSAEIAELLLELEIYWTRLFQPTEQFKTTNSFVLRKWLTFAHSTSLNVTRKRRIDKLIYSTMVLFYKDLKILF